MDHKQPEPTPFFSNPTVRKVYLVLFGIQFTLITGATIAGVFVEPKAVIVLVLIWAVSQLGFLSMVAVIYATDRFRNWVSKTYNPIQELVIYVAILTILVVIMRALSIF